MTTLAPGQILDTLALRNVHAGELDEAQALLDDLLRSEISSTDEGRARILLGEIATIRGDLAEALTQFERGIALLPVTHAAAKARGYRMLARALHGEGFTHRAERAFAEAERWLERIQPGEGTRRMTARGWTEHKLQATTFALASGSRALASEYAREAKAWMAHLASLRPPRAGANHNLAESDVVTEGLFLQIMGLVERAGGDERAWGNMLARAVQHFEAHGLRYHQARALDATARAYVDLNTNFAIDRMRAALGLYERIGARFLADRARDLLDEWEAVDRSLGGTPRDTPAAVVEIDYSAATFHGLTNTGHFLTELIPLIVTLARGRSSVLITGETGTGKDVVARALHAESPRASRIFLPVNSAAIPENRFEADFFGAAKGAYTGADSRKQGFAEAADGGTLFIDEIGDLPLEIQPKLLRFLESGEIHVLGDPKPRHVDVRVLAATNRDLAAMIRDGQFREDLYHRITRGGHLHLKPLRERRDEIRILAREFARDWASTEHPGLFVWFTDAAIAELERHAWPGNIRDLKHTVERLLASRAPRAGAASDLRIDAGELVFPSAVRPPSTRDAAPPEEPLEARGEHMVRKLLDDLSPLGYGLTPDARDDLSEFFRGVLAGGVSCTSADADRQQRLRYHVATLIACDGDADAARAIAGIPLSTWYRRMKVLGINRVRQ